MSLCESTDFTYAPALYPNRLASSLSPQPLGSEWVTQRHKRVMSELRQCPVALLQISTYMVRRSSAHSWGGGWNSHTAMRRNRHVVNIPLISSRQNAKSADAAGDLHYPNRYTCYQAKCIDLDSANHLTCCITFGATPTVLVAGITQRLQNATESLGKLNVATAVLKQQRSFWLSKVLGSWEFAHERCEKIHTTR